MKTLLNSLALLTLASAPFAQQVTFRGQVEDVQGTTNEFFLDCTTTDLSSFAVDLNLFVGVQVELTGQWNGSVAAPSVVVDTIQAVTETFEIGGGANIGEDSLFSFTGTPGQLAVGVISMRQSFLPFQGGVIFLDPTRIARNASGFIGPTGLLEIPFSIPNKPALVGRDIFGQGALISGPGLVMLTNPDCKTIGN